MPLTLISSNWTWSGGQCVRTNAVGSVVEVWTYSPQVPAPPCGTFSTREMVGYVAMGLLIAGVLVLASIKT